MYVIVRILTLYIKCNIIQYKEYKQTNYLNHISIIIIYIIVSSHNGSYRF